VVKRGLMRTIAVLGSGALVLAACGGDADEEADGAAEPTGEAAEEIVTDVGVTEEPCPDAVNPDNGCIYLGAISDLSEGPFATFGPELVRGHKDFWARVNADGGIGGYDIDASVNVVDAKYDPQTHSQVYREIEPNILALAETLGTAQTQAILGDMEADQVIGMPSTWWSGWAFEEEDSGVVIEAGASYCFQALSGLDWFAENQDEPTSIVSVGFPTDFGRDLASGFEAWAEANEVEYGGFLETGPNAQVGNQDAVVGQILSQSPDIVGLAVGPTETAEIVGKAAAQGFTGQFLGGLPTWNPALLGSAAAPALQALYTNVATHESYGADTPAHQAMLEARGADDVPPNDGYTFGWVTQYPLKAILEAAAANGDLTRQGVLDAIEGTEVDFEGSLPSVTLGGDPNDSADRSVTINKVDAEAPLGISAVETGYVGPTAEAFDYSAPCG